MAVLLTKIVNGSPAISSTLPNEQTVKCPRCEQTYRFAYTDDEWNKVSAWLGKADRAMRGEPQETARCCDAAIAMVNVPSLDETFFQFANPSKRKGKPGDVWTYEKGKPTHRRSTRSQGYQNGYFAYIKEDGTADESFESHLAVLEDRCAEVLVSAKSQLFDLKSLAYKNQLGFYAGMLFARSTVRRKFSESNWAKLQTPFAQLESDENYLRDAAAHYSEVLGETVTLGNITNAIRRVAATFTDKKLTGNSFIKDLLFHAEMLKGEVVPRPWQVLKAPAGTEFITSDNPVVTFIKLKPDLWHPGHGLRKPGVVVAFPLASTACLTIGVEGREFEEVDAATVMRMNDVVVRCCDRFVYSRTLSKEIEAMVNAVSRTSVPGETAFVGALPGTEQIQQYLRKQIGIQQAKRP